MGDDRIVEIVKGRGVHLPWDEIDTDRIIPARYLRCVTFDDLREGLFRDDRFGADGAELSHPLNDVRFQGASVLVAGRNFGCGSSREHAPQVLLRSGFRVVVAESFAEIFFGNSLTIGLCCVSVSRDDRVRLGAALDGGEQGEIKVDLRNRVIFWDSASAPLTLPDSARQAWLVGKWDPLQALTDNSDLTTQTWERLPYRRWLYGGVNNGDSQ